MYISRNMCARSCDYVYKRKATVCSVNIVELNVTVNNIKMSNVSQECFGEEFTRPAGKKKRTKVLV